ncbi:unnamed protein product [Prorocentrum cordatum]|uniref:Uncharacterized protein n=1 Tax=Prorocentrum cordatum TaxID=2364126 RepID=A0ABN9U6P5_9DINO|nr:unnamed protein product [Polarella glacialis]
MQQVLPFTAPPRPTEGRPGGARKQRSLCISARRGGPEEPSNAPPPRPHPEAASAFGFGPPSRSSPPNHVLVVLLVVFGWTPTGGSGRRDLRVGRSGSGGRALTGGSSGPGLAGARLQNTLASQGLAAGGAAVCK